MKWATRVLTAARAELQKVGARLGQLRGEELEEQPSNVLLTSVRFCFCWIGTKRGVG